jgi:hypothetical protein
MKRSRNSKPLVGSGVPAGAAALFCCRRRARRRGGGRGRAAALGFGRGERGGGRTRCGFGRQREAAVTVGRRQSPAGGGSGGAWGVGGAVR